MDENEEEKEEKEKQEQRERLEREIAAKRAELAALGGPKKRTKKRAYENMQEESHEDLVARKGYFFFHIKLL